MKKQPINNNNNSKNNVNNNSKNNNNVNNNNNNSDVNKKVEEMYLAKEELREDIIIDKRKILDLDQRNNLNIEALDNIVNMKSENKNGKLWIYTGDIFIQMKEGNAKELIIKENDSIESEIGSLQSGLVEKQQNLKQLEIDYQLERNKLFT
ncbi:hypothetical protein RB653_007896 [Dictyostelium firmibasis]|uniref:P53 and DNA damage-regulated protein 1 n=1 Tax=Dictyostelium firmibasis TaxID=79012 RepID=A0AAN7TMK0_9MYCE